MLKRRRYRQLPSGMPSHQLAPDDLRSLDLEAEQELETPSTTTTIFIQESHLFCKFYFEQIGVFFKKKLQKNLFL